MITLYASSENFGLPEVSPYVTKTEIQLKMAGLAYQKVPATPDTSPKGQLPWIDDDGQAVADSTFIRAHLERKYGFDLDAHLSPVQRAQAWAVERMLENQFAWTWVRDRWLAPENFAKGPAHFFDHLPEAIREQVRSEVQARVAANILAVGVGRHSDEEVLWLGTRTLDALDLLLGDRDWLFGDQPSGVDATALAMLIGVMTPYFDFPLRRAAMGYPTLVAYAARGMARFYPDFAWGVEMRQEEAA
ncbi:glutathione S-transferase [Caulobacter ginsengisoli]|uniref:Glutathione S-transferase n=1 Tax=Caulobacter ginsengisoli TaxID=400775 RepID=A0ABU0IV56_9CAUL|nr:glutathione S-transferase family protein [Caulobacter ginsengisoli]MDQ0465894.1 glutathione S-transferase [Caulobacter ginsengisoli]